MEKPLFDNRAALVAGYCAEAREGLAGFDNAALTVERLNRSEVS